MPTFSSLGGRELAGGDITPLFICPTAEEVSSAIASRTYAAGIELNLLRLTSFHLFLRFSIRTSTSGAEARTSGRLGGTAGSRALPDLVRALRTHGKAALHQQIHGAFDGDAHDTGFFIDPAVAVERLLFVHENRVQLPALVFLELRVGEDALGIAGSDVPRVLGNIRDEGIDWRLRGFLAMIEKDIESSETEKGEQRDHDQGQQEIENAAHLQILALEASVAWRGSGFEVVGHFSSRV